MIAAPITFSKPHVAALTARSSYLITVETIFNVSFEAIYGVQGYVVGKQAWFWSRC